ncbi:hypothetical protein OZX62_01600 [Bifidobacterium sp. ESL0690]|uniref:hypothetical protein n=1 Tax=Bifidobacterium sp. ESL0690 TaxID=2983214 RepID=UPI0023F6C3A1|nr:hypothetical protein [Bifidobacterium sp. ESL0690]WEV47018.1 hypothetical protein OZX62_01600 [Bifidobacterium sp. ESL0690]
MEEQGTFEGFEEITNYSHFKEKSTRKFIDGFFKKHTIKAEAEDYANSLICIAYNIDRYNSAASPKNISTLMESYNNTMASLRELYPETPEIDGSLASLLTESQAK